MSTPKGKKLSKRKASDDSSRANQNTNSLKVNNNVIDQSTLTGIQASLANISSRLTDCENNVKTFSALKDDIWEQDGINHQLSVVSEQAELATGDIVDLRDDNDQLRREVILLRSVIIRMDRKIQSMDKEITDLRSRSMRDNIVVHDYVYSANEDLMTSVPADIKKYLGVDVEFIRIHRNGPVRRNNGRPVTITGKLKDRNKKDAILRAQRQKKADKVKVPFFITAQEPQSVVENRKRLYELSDHYRSQNINTRVTKGGLTKPDGEPVPEIVAPLSSADLLQTPPEETKKLESLDTVSTEYAERHGTCVFAEGMKVTSVAEVQQVYKKACLNCDSASSDHRLLVYRFSDPDGKRYESYIDDGEHGVGRRLLRYMQDNQIDNVAVVISKWNGERYLGFERISMMENLINDIANWVLI